MANTVEQLIELAKALPANERAHLADVLVEGLDADGMSEIDALWISEAKRRRDEIRSDATQSIDGEAAIRQVRDSIR